MTPRKGSKAFDDWPQLDFDSPSSWRSWLERNHDRSPGVWLVFWKKSSGKGRLSHRQALEEALCYGWIDSLIHKLDEERYGIVFTPRKPGSIWSQINLGLVRRLKQEGRMTPVGLAKVDWSQDGRDRRHTEAGCEELAAELRKDPKAKMAFDALTQKQRAMHVHYLLDAKRPETRERRARRLAGLLSQGKRLGQP